MARPRIVQLICWSGAGSMSPDTRTPSSSVLLLLQLLDGPLHQLGIHLGGYWLYLQDQPKREHKDKGKAIYRRGKNEIHNTLHYTHKFLHFVMEKYCYSIFWTLSEIMSVCVVWLDAADCNEYLCSDTLNGSIDISIPRRHSVPVDSLGCMAGNEQSELELTTKCRENFTIFTGGAKCSAKCSAGSWNTESPPKVNHKRVVWLAQYSTDP